MKNTAMRNLSILNKQFLKPLFFYSLFSYFTLAAFAQNTNEASTEFNLIGKVTDEKTQFPLGGATLQIKGAYHETLADNDGEFIIKTKQQFPLTLVVSYVGYETKEVVVNNAQKVV